MANFIVMPKMGLTMTEGVILNWRKQEGDTIKKGDIIFDVETDKLTNEYDSKAEGVLRKILVEEGTVPVLAPVAIIGNENEDITDLLNQASGTAEPSLETEQSAEVQPEISTGSIDSNKGGRVKASPRAKKIARELGVDISFVKSTGPDGSVTENDVKNYADKLKNESKKASPTAAVVASQLGVDTNEIEKDTRIMKDDVIKYKLSKELTKYAAPQEFRKPMSSMRKVIAKRMLESKQVSPTVTYNLKVDTTAMKKLREDIKDEMKISYNDILVKVLSKVLLEFPVLNSSVDGNEVVTRNYVNMGVAVALPEGLLVPVVKYANVKGLKEISEEVKALASKAKSNELTSDDLTGGTFTISNIGMYGMESFTPIVNQPEVAILGVNAINEEVKVVNGEITIKPMMNLSLTADHRVVDGAEAARFMAKLKEYIEKPGLLLL
ncbi:MULTISPECIES: dihydrolipoamide acetyltransferase family protein [unclassified Sedimentibacter]|uniref:dihydrolipoamide acetyltransferase family protein n=1 Tax=unclassified Sedimentibacter TaxID=2649220 RepID=UPI0027E1E89F|nr:dihydrolipoamide acetyltransferase family protein [Sedimentibacter sp. MB35-C1]WMJ78821.1 dihydrolipoamide acetyltransferase family protein [Sedimentibacter sp. MB35-C1]